MQSGPEGSLRYGWGVGVRCLPIHRLDLLGSNVAPVCGVRTVATGSGIAHTPRVIVVDVIPVAVVDVLHVLDAPLAAAHGHFAA